MSPTRSFLRVLIVALVLALFAAGTFPAQAQSGRRSPVWQVTGLGKALTVHVRALLAGLRPAGRTKEGALIDPNGAPHAQGTPFEPGGSSSDEGALIDPNGRS